jgi:hypothetical protein
MSLSLDRSTPHATTPHTTTPHTMTPHTTTTPARPATLLPDALRPSRLRASRLTEAGRGHSAPQLRRIVLDLAKDPTLVDRVPVSATERTWTSLDVGADACAWVIRWPAGISSGWHDHGGPGTGVSGAFTVLQGHLRERAWSDYGPLTRHLGPGQVRSFAPSYVHEVSGDGEPAAITVHAYSPRLTEMRTYRIESRIDGDELVYVETSDPDEW